MGEFNFEPNGTRTFLVYRLDENEQIDSLAMGMFENNKIKNILAPNYYQVDKERFLKYDVTSKINLEMYIKTPSSKKQFLTFISGLVGAYISAEQFYTLLSESFCTDPKYIFISSHSGEVNLIYLPIEGYEKSFDLTGFIREITSRKVIEPREDDIYTGVFNILNDNSITKFSDLKRRIDSLNVPSTSQTKYAPKESSVSKEAMEEGTKIVKQGANHELNEAEKNKVIEKRNDAEKNAIKIPFIQQKNIADKDQPNQKEEKKEGFFGFFKSKKKDAPVKDTALKDGPASFNIPGQSSNVDSKGNSGVGTPPSKFSNNSFAKPEANVNNVKSPFNGNQADFRPRNSSSPIEVGMSKNSPDPVAKVDNNNIDFDVHTVVLEDEGYESTIVIDNVFESKENPRLCRKSTKEIIKITSSFFKIGRSSSNVDYTITNNAFVGSFHAYILKEDGKYFVVDNNSKNHTFINDGMPIPPNEKIEIYHGSSITFANEQFDFFIR